MIAGVVNASLEPTLRVTILGNPGRQEQVEPIIDTGYNGSLTLPSSVIASLGLTFWGRDQGVLADGTTVPFDVFRATIVWDGQLRVIEVESIEATPLLGTALLARHEARMQFVDGGRVEIKLLP